MGRKRRIEITVETDRVTIIRSDRNVLRGWCQRCGEQVSMLTVDQAASVACLTPRTINSLVEAERLHFTQTPEGSLLVCLNSVTAVTSGK
ncbi:MAG: hypothetical protein HY650_03000 [Acidobacteria bacterium]|nr:hypothetical protein [Acidobacteriota bacterium]